MLKKNYCPTSNCSVLSAGHHLFLPLVFDYKESGGKKSFLRHTGTKVRGGTAQAKSVNMKKSDKAEMEIMHLLRRKAITNKRTFPTITSLRTHITNFHTY